MNVNHIHAYRRAPKSKKIYLCSHPECFHRMDKQFLEGKACACPCGEIFTLDKYDLKLAQPLCHKVCSPRPEFVAERNRIKLLEEIGI